MERLTKRDTTCKGAYYLCEIRSPAGAMVLERVKGKEVDRLAAYEDTGLTPERVAAVVKENGELRARQWISVKERLPIYPDGYILVPYLVFHEGFVRTAYWSDEEDGWMWVFQGKRIHPTHWMPLPQPPEDSKED